MSVSWIAHRQGSHVGHTQMGCSLTLDAGAPAVVALQIASSHAAPDTVVVIGPDGPVPSQELHVGGNRTHIVALPVGLTVVRYDAQVRWDPTSGEVVTEADAVLYRRQSRYCPSDKLEAFVTSHLAADLEASDVGGAIAAWVNRHLSYESGASDATTDALDTLVAGAGVCRDFAHLTVTLARACGIPARFTSVYAPGLEPMDFHAVAEIATDGRWVLQDATRLAPRAAMARIATGRDAADCAMLTTLDGTVDLVDTEVTAVDVSDDGLPVDDVDAPAFLP